MESTSFARGLGWVIVCCGLAGSAWGDGALTKTDVAGKRLLLPFFTADTQSFTTPRTLFAVRNERAEPVDIEIHYFATDRPDLAQKVEPMTLAAKQVKTINIASVPGLSIDDDGIIRGFAIVEVMTEGGIVQGDFFLVTAAEAFASGDRLVNIDPQSVHNELCGRYSIRFFNGGVFSGGTRFTFWLEADGPPSVEQPVFFYSVYDEAGNLVFAHQFFAEEVSFRVSAEELVASLPIPGPDFGAIEFQFNQTVGHVSAVMDARGLFSVALPGACLDVN